MDKSDDCGEMIVVKTHAGDIKCEKSKIGDWFVIEDKNQKKQYFGKSFESCINGIQKFYSGEIGKGSGDADFLIYTSGGTLILDNDTPIYMIIKYRDQSDGKIYLTQANDFGLEFKLLDEDEIEVVERVHYSENTIDKALRRWSEELGLPILRP
jgi:hypothetical protein